jgi:hypothetical protein
MGAAAGTAGTAIGADAAGTGAGRAASSVVGNCRSTSWQAPQWGQKFVPGATAFPQLEQNILTLLNC